MFIILEKFFFICGLIINFQLILNLLIRPVLWSTTNTFIGCILASNLLYLTFQSLLTEESEITIPDENIILHYLEYNFSDNYKSLLCSAKYISQFLHGTFTVYILVGIVFMRSMMVKFADNIQTNNCKAHQASLSFIGILVSVFIFTSCTGVVLTLIIYPLPSSEFVLVRNCRAVTFQYESTQYGMWLPSSVIKGRVSYQCKHNG